MKAIGPIGRFYSSDFPKKWKNISRPRYEVWEYFHSTNFLNEREQKPKILQVASGNGVGNRLIYATDRTDPQNSH